MNKLIGLFLLSFVGMSAHAELKVGSIAPDFALTDATGTVQNLKDYRGKVVVLEWYNKDCPYVKKHYSSGNMQKIQRTYTEKNVVWLSIITGAPKKQGFMTPQETLKNYKAVNQASTAVLSDNGDVGRLYNAKTTPHMFVINEKGTIVYNGAIDDNDSSSADVIPTSKNYVVAALDSVLKGEKVAIASTKPYGCSVKY